MFALNCLLLCWRCRLQREKYRTMHFKICHTSLLFIYLRGLFTIWKFLLSPLCTSIYIYVYRMDVCNRNCITYSNKLEWNCAEPGTTVNESKPPTFCSASDWNQSPPSQFNKYVWNIRHRIVGSKMRNILINKYWMNSIGNSDQSHVCLHQCVVAMYVWKWNLSGKFACPSPNLTTIIHTTNNRTLFNFANTTWFTVLQY